MITGILLLTLLSLALAVTVGIAAVQRDKARAECESLRNGQTLLAAQRDTLQSELAELNEPSAACSLAWWRKYAHGAERLRQEEQAKAIAERDAQAKMFHEQLCEAQDEAANWEARAEQCRAAHLEAERKLAEWRDEARVLVGQRDAMRAQRDEARQRAPGCPCNEDGDLNCDEVWALRDKLEVAHANERRLAAELSTANQARNKAECERDEAVRAKQFMEHSLRANLEAPAEEVRQCRARIEELQAQKQRMMQQLEAAGKQLAEPPPKCKGCHKVKELGDALHDANERCNAIAEQRDAYGNEDATMVERLNEASRLRSEAEDERDEARGELNREQYAHSDTRAKLDSAVHELNMVERRLEKRDATISELRKELRDRWKIDGVPTLDMRKAPAAKTNKTKGGRR